MLRYWSNGAAWTTGNCRESPKGQVTSVRHRDGARNRRSTPPRPLRRAARSSGGEHVDDLSAFQELPARRPRFALPGADHDVIVVAGEGDATAGEDLFGVQRHRARRCQRRLVEVVGTKFGRTEGGIGAEDAVLDAIGGTQDGYGRYMIDFELAGVEDPGEMRRLATFSSYDPRCPRGTPPKSLPEPQATRYGESWPCR